MTRSERFRRAAAKVGRGPVKFTPADPETTTVVTRFRLDERLQIMVPELMRTQNPAGVATYRHYRRFAVSTESEVAEENR